MELSSATGRKVCACVRAHARARVRMCVFVRACLRACVCARVCGLCSAVAGAVRHKPHKYTTTTAELQLQNYNSQLQLRNYNCATTTAQLQLHNYNSQLQLHSYNYTATTTELQLHNYCRYSSESLAKDRSHTGIATPTPTEISQSRGPVTQSRTASLSHRAELSHPVTQRYSSHSVRGKLSLNQV